VAALASFARLIFITEWTRRGEKTFFAAEERKLARRARLT
jgi:hypothetical protein